MHVVSNSIETEIIHQRVNQYLHFCIKSWMKVGLHPILARGNSCVKSCVSNELILITETITTFQQQIIGNEPIGRVPFTLQNTSIYRGTCRKGNLVARASKTFSRITARVIMLVEPSMRQIIMPQYNCYAFNLLSNTNVCIMFHFPLDAQKIFTLGNECECI